ncbi:lysophospholipid acyltransferase family protein [Sphingomonas sp. NSE70-1]|uniref:Lysophospholipid acyltransferase family protein n=1 Tax=Sphingomonas caseinilyticus TaxID=2908205 RepID=A0ABT0RV10_9SPHN|nr:lysophospholipid acyltransferase family protein [Sphingomonas caseinilyticus]MCL6698869.1 lysophospholipid acyltransferase family protein [Sphingomonas caseinilyticus]
MGGHRLNWLERLIHWILLRWFVRNGWTVSGTLPPDLKIVIMGASHTSNWDFLVFLGAVHSLNRKVHFIGKHSLFRWPLGGFMHALGGIPVDRGSRQDLVSQVVAQFDAHDEFILVVAPEGTRSRTKEWKTGFYQIALKAGAPIVPAGPDFPSKRAVFGAAIRPTGNYAEDMKPAFHFFRTIVPRHPERSDFPDGF